MKTLVLILATGLALILSGCPGTGGEADAGPDGYEDATLEDGFDADGLDGADDGDAAEGDGDLGDGGDLAGDSDGQDGADDGDGTDGGDPGGDADPGPIYPCPFPFSTPIQHTLIDDFGSEIQVRDRHILCSLDHDDLHAQIYLTAQPTGTQWMDILYEETGAWVCRAGQVQSLPQGDYRFEAMHHGWDELEVAFDGRRYLYSWSEICIGFRPCTRSFDQAEVRDLASGALLDTVPATCAEMGITGKPRPLTPQVRIPPTGDEVVFSMGSVTGPADEQPVHQVTMKPVRLDVREASWQDLAWFVDDHGNDCDGQACLDLQAAAAHLEQRDGHWVAVTGSKDTPATHLSWHGADEYCRWRRMSLPSEAAFELAASGAGTRIYPWGDDPPDCNRALYADCGPAAPDPGCSRPTGNTPEGVCDLAGNLAEWMVDWYAADYYSSCTAGCIDPKGPTTPTGVRTVRGGSYAEPGDAMRSSARSSGDPAQTDPARGVRCLQWTFPASL